MKKYYELIVSIQGSLATMNYFFTSEEKACKALDVSGFKVMQDDKSVWYYTNETTGDIYQALLVETFINPNKIENFEQLVLDVNHVEIKFEEDNKTGNVNVLIRKSCQPNKLAFAVVALVDELVNQYGISAEDIIKFIITTARVDMNWMNKDHQKDFGKLIDENQPPTPETIEEEIKPKKTRVRKKKDSK